MESLLGGTGQNFRGMNSRGLLCNIVIMVNDIISCSLKPLRIKIFYNMVILVRKNVLYS